MGTIKLKRFLSCRISQSISYVNVDYISPKVAIIYSRFSVHGALFFQGALYSLGNAEGISAAQPQRSVLCQWVLSKRQSPAHCISPQVFQDHWPCTSVPLGCRLSIQSKDPHPCPPFPLISTYLFPPHLACMHFPVVGAYPPTRQGPALTPQK